MITVQDTSETEMTTPGTWYLFRRCWGVLPSPTILLGFPGGSDGKAIVCNSGDLGSVPGSGRSPGERNGNPLQYSCLENFMDGGAWQATVHGVAKSRTRLSNFTGHHSVNLPLQVLRAPFPLPQLPRPFCCCCYCCLAFRSVPSLPTLALRWFSEVKCQSLSRVRLFSTPWTVACQAPPSMGFSKQEYQCGLPFPPPGDLPDPGIEPASPELQMFQRHS